MSGAVDYLLGLDSVDRRPRSASSASAWAAGSPSCWPACGPTPSAPCVPFYGLIPWPHAQPDCSRLDAPVLGHYADDDGFFTPELVDELEDQLDSLGKEADLEVYPGVDHAFFNDTRPEVYDAEASARAWVADRRFLHANLD